MNGLKTLLDLSLLQSKPQDIPHSPILLLVVTGVSIGAYTLAVAPAAAQLGSLLDREIRVVPLALAEHFFYAFTVWLVLRLRLKQERFVQTLTAMFAVNATIQFVIWPVTSWALSAQESQATGTPTFLLLALRVWLLVASAHIFKESLEVGLGGGILFTLGCWVFASFLLLVFLNLVG